MLGIGSPFLAGFLWIFKWAGDRFVPWLMAFLWVAYKSDCIKFRPKTTPPLMVILHSRITFQLSIVVLYPTVIQPLFNQLSPLGDGYLKNRIESLAARLKFPLKHLYEIDGSKRSSHSNAYFFGLPWVCHLDSAKSNRSLFWSGLIMQSKHIVIYDTLIKESSSEEVEAVLGQYLPKSIICPIVFLCCLL